MAIDGLRLEQIGPFDHVTFKFDSKINVFVGPNNTGKTTVLLALAEMIVDGFALPKKALRPDSRPVLVIGGGKGQKRFLKRFASENSAKVGPEIEDLGYRAFVPAMRLSTDYRSSGPVRAREEEKTHSIIVSKHFMEERKSETASASWLRDEQVIQQIIELDYRAYREGKPAIRKVIDSIASLASEITEGFPIEFAGVGEDESGLYPRFRTPDGQVPLNVLSQGTQSLIQWCAKLLIEYSAYYRYPKSLKKKPGVLIIDEIDAHLHPSWQRRVLPALRAHFPALQVFCAAHSPMTLAGLTAGQVQLLRRNKDGRVEVSLNESDIVGWSVDQIYTNLFSLEPTDSKTSEDLKRLRALRAKGDALDPPERAALADLRKSLGTRISSGSTVDVDDARALLRRAKEAASTGKGRRARKATPRKTAVNS